MQIWCFQSCITFSWIFAAVQGDLLWSDELPAALQQQEASSQDGHCRISGHSGGPLPGQRRGSRLPDCEPYLRRPSSPVQELLQTGEQRPSTTGVTLSVTHSRMPICTTISLVSRSRRFTTIENSCCDLLKDHPPFIPLYFMSSCQWHNFHEQLTRQRVTVF